MAVKDIYTKRMRDHAFAFLPYFHQGYQFRRADAAALMWLSDRTDRSEIFISGVYLSNWADPKDDVANNIKASETFATRPIFDEDASAIYVSLKTPLEAVEYTMGEEERPREKRRRVTLEPDARHILVAGRTTAAKTLFMLHTYKTIARLPLAAENWDERGLKMLMVMSYRPRDFSAYGLRTGC